MAVQHQNSQDRTVAEIAELGYCLYSDAHGDREVWPYRWRQEFYEGRRQPRFLAGPPAMSRS